jgi:hypothetical protein
MKDTTYINFPVKSVVPLSQMAGLDDEDSRLLRVMAEGAQNYIRCFPWCKSVRDVYFGDGYGGIVAVFLFHIEARRAEIDEWLWVVFGDVPPAYLVTDIAKSPSQAIEVYVAEVSKWTELAKAGKSSKDVIPVYVPATPENAADVERRMKLLREIIVPAFREAEIVRT